MSVILNAQTNQDNFTHWDLTPDIDRPWEIVWGPDGWIWYTERSGKISRVSPETGENHLLLDHRSEVVQTHESGMLGLALHPDFENAPYVFVSYSYLEEDDTAWLTVGKWRYDAELDQLVDEERIVPPSSIANIHAGSRLLAAADNTLYITIGDRSERDLPQDIEKLQGKILRVNFDGSVPEDNPFEDNLVWSLGHRNPQGLCWGPNGQLFSTEHGTFSDDELNIIAKGGNYGWPEVQGYCDNEIEEVWCEVLNVIEPITTWTPSIAPSGTLYYDGAAFPEWGNSIFVSTLKNQAIYRMQMNAAADEVESEEILFSQRWGRLRDFAFSPEGRVFISTTNSERDLPLPDRILEVLRIVEGQNLLIGSIDEPTFKTEVWSLERKEVTVFNNADEPLRIYNMRMEGADANVFFVDESVRSFVIPANGEVQVTIGFAPKVLGTDFQASFVFDGNDRQGTYQLALSGVADAFQPLDGTLLADFGRSAAGLRQTFTYVIDGANPQYTGETLAPQTPFTVHEVQLLEREEGIYLELDIEFLGSPEPESSLLTVTGINGGEPINIVVLANQPEVIWLTNDLRVIESVTGPEVGICEPSNLSVQMFNRTDQSVALGIPPLIESDMPLRFEVLNAAEVGTELAAREFKQIDFRFAAAEVDRHAVQLFWPTTTPEVSFAPLEVEMTVVPRPVVTGDRVEFAPTRIADRASVVHQYVNTIMELAQVTDVRIIGDDADDFRLINWLGRSVKMDKSMCSALAFVPQSEGTKFAQLEISIADLFAPIYVDLFGSGVSSVAGPDFPSGWNIRVQPNPVQGELTVDFGLDQTRSWHLSIIGLDGRTTELARGFSDAETLEFDRPSLELSAGLYIVRLQAEDQSIDFSLVVE